MTPVDEHARAFLGQSLKDPGILAESHATLSWFPNPDDARIYRAVRACVSLGIEPDTIALCDQLQAQGLDSKTAANLAVSIDCAYSSANASYHAGKLALAARARELKQGFGVVSEMLDAGADSQTIEAKVAGLVEGAARTESLDRFKPVSIESERLADIPARQWAVEGMIPHGELTIIGSRKGMGKSWFALQAGAAIASGNDLLGLSTFKGSVLYWPSELDRTSVHERAQHLGKLPDGFDVMYEQIPRGLDLLESLPGIIRGYGYKVVILDMLQAAMPTDTDSNAYEAGHFLLALRRIAMDTGAAIVGTWHNGKADRDDPVLSLIGSTGIGAQAGSIVTIDRKRGEEGAKIYVSGNHAHERTIRTRFIDCQFELSDASDEGPKVAPADKVVLDVVQAHPEGIAVTTLSGTISKEANSIRSALSRLGARGLVEKRGDRWHQTLVKEVDLIGFQSARTIAHEAHEIARSAPSAGLAEGLEAHRTAPAPKGAVRSCATPEPVRPNKGIDKIEDTIIRDKPANTVKANTTDAPALPEPERPGLDYGDDNEPSGAHGDNPEYCEESEYDIF